MYRRIYLDIVAQDRFFWKGALGLTGLCSGGILCQSFENVGMYRFRQKDSRSYACLSVVV